MEVGTKSKIITLLFLLAATASSQNTTRCPFKYFYEFGDGYSDIGNSIRIQARLPAARLPYGTTFPGTPTGRWSDGRIEADYAAEGVGLPNIRPYLSMGCNSSSAHDDDGIVFAVAGSTFLDRPFFIRRNITIRRSYATPLPYQINWFRKYLTSVSSNPTECKNRVANSLILLVFPLSNDIGYALDQGKSIQQVYTYVPFIIQAQIRSARRLIEMGARRIVMTGDVPLGCFPFILTALSTTDPSAYDALGCLKSVNSLIIYKNNALEKAINDLKAEFPNVTILYIDGYQVGTTVISQMIASGGGNIGLRACCGIGGKYNHNWSRPCGSPGVPVCANPNQYIFWDGDHYTQEVYRRIADIVTRPGLLALNCTS